MAFSGLVCTGLLMGLVACGGSQTPQASGPQPATAKEGEVADAGPEAAAAAAPPERPFAGSATEATQLISGVVDKYTDPVSKCVREYRARKNLPRQRVELSVGIDQDGRLLGVTLKGKPDPTLSSCVQDVLKGAMFPRSHAGVITVTKSYEEIVQ
ncbi:hypothetical protein AKJ09_02576 [Labilithrix luteola]|uniref:AgmX/PglI C-terminal domain-containing protein n=1 Tax=Labilithrix luteola TaxID=1391654 RepID=A0A0K1PQV8_9BACT|nr:hypothetical protein AKJ09_02576 [Labilithrix luteola]